MQKIRLRFAPSPTGFIHIGSLRPVLFNYLIAKSLGGKVILRIEDTDQARTVPGAFENLIEILDWLEIKFDEGPHIICPDRSVGSGDFGPYIQSQRVDIYKKYAAQLLKSGGAYYCFCAPERLQKMREDRQAKKLPPRYDRVCRDLDDDEIKKRIERGEKYVIRQKMPLEGEVIVHDELRGGIKFKASELEDHVLIKSDGMPTYQFAVVVDDHLMQISHVVRGDEWIPSFPKNILLYRAFGWEPPKFIHTPLTLSKDGGKLSKRHGDVAIEDYRKNGYLKEALINFCALLGWHPKDEREFFTLAELEKEFKIEDMGASPAIFDIEKLDYFNGYYIRQKPLDELVLLCKPHLEKHLKRIAYEGRAFVKIASDSRRMAEYAKKVIALEQERLKKLSEIGELTEFFFVENLEYPAELLIWKNLPKEKIKNNLEQVCEQLEKIPEENWTNDSIEEALMSHIQLKGGKVGEYLWPLRAALTGRQASPGPFDVAEVLGKEESLKRVKEAIGKL
ncbi:glutamate--tRNA ligase [Patescibacteria group bacterium]|nr:glutamate--tRNA ligase [Patescibacteria group bacterium]